MNSSDVSASKLAELEQQLAEASGRADTLVKELNTAKQQAADSLDASRAQCSQLEAALLAARDLAEMAATDLKATQNQLEVANKGLAAAEQQAAEYGVQVEQTAAQVCLLKEQLEKVGTILNLPSLCKARWASL